MKPLRPDTFMLTLPDGQKVRCWRKDAENIRRDVQQTGTVRLIRDPLTDVYDWVAADSVEAKAMDPIARRIG